MEPLNELVEGLNEFVESSNKLVEPLAQLIGRRNEFVEGLDQVVEPLHKLVEPRDELIELLDKLVERPNKVVEPLDELVELLDQLIEPRDKLVEALSKAVERLDRLVELRNKLVSRLDQLVEALDESSEPLDKPVEPPNKLVERLDKLVEPSNKLVEPLNKLIEGLNKVVEVLDKFVEPLARLIERRNKVGEGLDNLIEPLHQLVEQSNGLVEPPDKLVERRNKVVEPLDKVVEPRFPLTLDMRARSSAKGHELSDPRVLVRPGLAVVHLGVSEIAGLLDQVLRGSELVLAAGFVVGLQKQRRVAGLDQEVLHLHRPLQRKMAVQEPDRRRRVPAFDTAAGEVVPEVFDVEGVLQGLRLGERLPEQMEPLAGLAGLEEGDPFVAPYRDGGGMRLTGRLPRLPEVVQSRLGAPGEQLQDPEVVPGEVGTEVAIDGCEQSLRFQEACPGPVDFPQAGQDGAEVVEGGGLLSQAARFAGVVEPLLELLDGQPGEGEEDGLPEDPRQSQVRAQRVCLRVGMELFLGQVVSPPVAVAGGFEVPAAELGQGEIRQSLDELATDGTLFVQDADRPAEIADGVAAEVSISLTGGGDAPFREEADVVEPQGRVQILLELLDHRAVEPAQVRDLRLDGDLAQPAHQLFLGTEGEAGPGRAPTEREWLELGKRKGMEPGVWHQERIT